MVVEESLANRIWEQMFHTPSPSINFTMAQVGAPSWHPIECAPAALLDHEVHVRHEAYFDANVAIDDAMNEVKVWYDASDADAYKSEATEPVWYDASDADFPTMEEAATVDHFSFAPSTPVAGDLLAQADDFLAALGQELAAPVETTYSASPVPITGDLLAQADDFLAVLGEELAAPVQPASPSPSQGDLLTQADNFLAFLGEELALGIVRPSTPLHRKSTTTTVGSAPPSPVRDTADLLAEIFAGSPRPATFEDMAARPQERSHTPSLDDDVFAPSPNSTVLPTPPRTGLGLLCMSELAAACDDLFAATNTVKGERGVVTYQDVPGAFDEDEDD
ncbi:hypothetical protein C8Q80DRAFT_387132 [Daedaleopsis nitida]|nr:hypothetical protein C8Q80DRAFT_387132 [Daedaleopsis nitida]